MAKPEKGVCFTEHIFKWYTKRELPSPFFFYFWLDIVEIRKRKP